MPAFAEKYTDAQRDAVAHAYNDRGIRPARRIQELAAAGELTHKGETLEPFDMPIGSILGYAATDRKRRLGKTKSTLAELPHRDAIEAIRRRLIASIDTQLADLERKASRKGAKPIDPAQLQALARATREAAAIPTPKDPAPTRPGQRKPDGKHEPGDRKPVGLAAQVIAAARHEPNGHGAEPAQEAKPNTHTEGNEAGDAAQQATQPDAETEHDDVGAGPGDYARATVQG